MVNNPLASRLFDGFQCKQRVQSRAETDFEQLDFLFRDLLQSGADKNMFRFLARAVYRVVVFVHLRHEERMGAVGRQLQFPMYQMCCFHARKGTEILLFFSLERKELKVQGYTSASTNGGVELKSRETRFAQTAEIFSRSTPPFALRRFR